MENNKKGNSDECGGMCGGMCKSMCGGGHHGHHPLIWVIKILILVVVFWIGLKIGEIKGSLEGGYSWGPRMMLRYGYSENNSSYYPPMMDNQNWTYQATSTKSGKK